MADCLLEIPQQVGEGASERTLVKAVNEGPSFLLFMPYVMMSPEEWQSMMRGGVHRDTA